MASEKLTALFGSKGRPEMADPITRYQIDQIIAKTQGLLEGVSCLTGNAGGLAAQVNLKLAQGDLTQSQANDILTRLHNAHVDVERACSAYGHARELLPIRPEGDPAPAR